MMDRATLDNMLLKLCACCLLVAGLCDCNRLSNVRESENNLASSSLHLSSSKTNMVDADVSRIQDLDVTQDDEPRMSYELVSIARGQRPCQYNLCCPRSYYCCSNFLCCRGKNKTPQRPCAP